MQPHRRRLYALALLALVAACSSNEVLAPLTIGSDAGAEGGPNGSAGGDAGALLDAAGGAASDAATVDDATVTPRSDAASDAGAAVDADGADSGSLEDARADSAVTERLVLTEGYEATASGWNLVARQEHEYEGDRRARTRTSFLEQGTWNEDSTTTYRYDGDLLAATHTNYLQSSLLAEDELRNFYDAGRLVRQEGGYLETEGGEWVWDTRVALDYSEAGLLLHEEQEHHFSWGWRPETRTTHEYDAAGVQTRTTVFSYGIHRDIERHVFEYDAKGRPQIETVFKVPEGGADIAEKRFVNTYR